MNTEKSLLSSAMEKELMRWHYDVYEKKEQTQFSDSLWLEQGFMIRFQHDYQKEWILRTSKTYRRMLPDNERRIWIWWKDNVNHINFLDNDWINDTRDSLMQQHIKGSRDSMYVFNRIQTSRGDYNISKRKITWLRNFRDLVHD